jgi:hypothetical protein
MRTLMLLTVLVLGATAAQAENGFFYLGAGVTNSSLTAYPDGFGDTRTDLKDNSWKAFAGVRPLKWLAVEADYIDLGSGSGGGLATLASFNNTHADSSAWAAYAVGFLPVPLPVVDFYGKAGIARWKLNSSISTVSLFAPYDTLFSSTSSTTGTEFAWGVGVQAHVSMFGARLEYEQFNIPNTSGAKVASLSVFLNF